MTWSDWLREFGQAVALFILFYAVRKVRKNVEHLRRVLGRDPYDGSS